MRGTVRSFARSEGGQTAAIFALMTVPLMGFIGMAVDGARWYQGRQATSHAVDAAVLAAARKMQLEPDNVTAAMNAARQTYLAHIASRNVPTRDTVEFVLVDNSTSVTARGEAVMSTSFLSLIGIPELPMFQPGTGESAKATFLSGLNEGTNIELSLVLDFTGSMCDSGDACSSGVKLQGLRDAAKELVGIVVNDNQSAYTSRIALVPFSTRIRVADDHSDGTLMQRLTGMPTTWSGYVSECQGWTGSGTGGGGETNETGTWTCSGGWQTVLRSNWKILPCVTERLYGTRWDADDTIDYSDRTPGPGYWLNAHGGDRAPYFADSSQDFGLTPNTQATPTGHWNYYADSYCNDVPETNVVLPLSSDKERLRNTIDAYTASGATAGPLGTAFGWYMLSPNWSSVWPSASQPGSYADLTDRQSNGAPKLRKVAVIMTDGVYNTMRGSKELHKGKVADHAREMCRGMKDKGIEVYTVGFALDQLTGSDKSTAENMLKDCGTSVRHFYSTLNVPQLKEAFRDIALRVTPVRLTQ
jgi:Flp pilus assembly protein TadG